VRLGVLVVDDEPLARSGVSDLVARDPELHVVGECGDGPAAVEAIARLAPDIVLLDVQMPGMDGFGVLREVVRASGDRPLPEIVFITAYDRFALRAFEVSAVDYLLKPFDDDRFAAALARAKRRHADAEVADAARRLLNVATQASSMRVPAAAPRGLATPSYPSRILVKTAQRSELIATTAIDWIEAADYYARLHVGARAHLVRETMASLEDRLDPACFVRVNRSAIVNLERVRELRPHGRGAHVVVLADGTRVKLTRERKERLESALGQRL
jgi:two-component system LytT family response regulator